MRAGKKFRGCHGQIKFCGMERRHLVKKKDLLEYSLQIAMLNQLKNKKMISDKEYNMILKRLKSDYGVVSNICC